MSFLAGVRSAHTVPVQCNNLTLKALGIPANFGVMAQALFRPLSPRQVQEALKRLNTFSSPGEGGISAKIILRRARPHIPNYGPLPPKPSKRSG